MSTDRRPRHGHARASRPHARRRTRAGGRIAVLAAAVPVGLVVGSALVWQASSAAFMATTDNPGSAWQTGVVQLSSDRTTALFTTLDEGLLVPGSSGSRCITVNYSGSVSTAEAGVRLYGTLTTDSPELAGALQLTVQMSTTAVTTGADCAGFGSSSTTYPAGAASAFPTGYGAGLGDLNADGTGDWRPSATADRSRTYRISYRLPAAPYSSSVQGKKVGMTFTWEVQSDDTPGT